MSPLRPLTILKAAAERAARGETLLKLGECAVHAEPVERGIQTRDDDIPLDLGVVADFGVALHKHRKRSGLPRLPEKP